jgi:hypothetical protein
MCESLVESLEREQQDLQVQISVLHIVLFR